MFRNCFVVALAPCGEVWTPIEVEIEVIIKQYDGQGGQSPKFLL